MLAGEVKWSGSEPLIRLAQAAKYLATLDNFSHHIIVAGSNSKNLRSMRETTIDRKIQEAYKSRITVERRYSCRSKTRGTGVIEYRADKTTVWVLLVPFVETELEYAFSETLGIFLLRPKQPEECEEKDFLALAQGEIHRYLVGMLDLPRVANNYLQLRDKTIEKLPSARFITDPWSSLTEDYLKLQSKRTPKKYRWIRLAHHALRMRAAKASPPDEATLAAKIPPIPLRCGSIVGSEIVNDLQSVIYRRSVQPGTDSVSTDIRIIEGTAGTGKSTLLEFIYNSHIGSLLRGSGASPLTGIPFFIDLQRDSDFLKRLSGVSDDSSQHVISEILGHFAGFGVPEDKDSAHQTGRIWLEALLLHYRMNLYIDGYDQLSAEDRDRLIQFGTLLSKQGYEIEFVLISSRPGHNVLLALDWNKMFPEVPQPDETSVRRLAPPDRASVEEYCQSWLDELSSVMHDAEQNADELTAQYFLDNWLSMFTHLSDEGGPSDLVTASDATASAIQRNPLLLMMSLTTYMYRVGRSQLNKTYEIATIADLYEKLIEELHSPEPTNIEIGGDPRGNNLLQVDEWREWFERSCYRALRQDSRTVGKISSAIFQNEWTSNTPAFENLNLNLPFLETRSEKNGETYFEFIHPSFHEYFASSYVYRSLESGKFPVIQADGYVHNIPWQDATHLGRSNGLVTTEFARAVVGLGRDSFKYLLGRLLRYSTTLRRGNVIGLERLSVLLDDDYGLQQYLYDSGYVDRSVNELQLSVTQVQQGKKNSKAYAIRKLVAHQLYGDPEGFEKSISQLAMLERDCTTDTPSTKLSQWIRIFAIDHIDNRRKRLSPEQAKILLGDDINSWKQTRWYPLINGLGVFNKPDLPKNDKKAGELATVLEPRWETDLTFVLRAAHYWGHQGNQVLIELTYLPQGVDKSRIKNALSQYARAIVYRLVALFLTVGRNFEDKILALISSELPVWFEDWVVRGGSEPNLLQTDDAGRQIARFERFVGPTQAIADIANQYSCRANILLWEWALFEDNQSLDNAKSEYDKSRSLWKMARELRIEGVQGELMIRYFLHLSGVDVRLAMAESIVSQDTVWSEENVRHNVALKLEDYEREYGMGYELAAQDVHNSCISFWTLIRDKWDKAS